MRHSTVLFAEQGRLLEATPCGQGYIRLDLWIGTVPPLTREWVILAPDEWRALRRYRPSSSSVSHRGGAPRVNRGGR